MMADSSRHSRARNRRRLRRRRPRRRPAVEHRNWAELPWDVLTVIFHKLGGIDVLWKAQAVCRPWRQLALDPQAWHCIDMRHHSDLFNVIDMEEPTRIAVDRSGGFVEEFLADYFGSDDLLTYIADRTTGLRRLVLIAAYEVSDEGLIEFVGRCPLLEEIQITNCSFSEEAYRDIGRARPELKCFRLNKRFYKIPFSTDETDIDYDCDSEALEIANNMPQLREFQLIGNQITNKGLHAILDKCIHLECLDIRACLSINVDDAGLRAKLAKIKTVKLPLDSTAGYEFETGMEEDEFDGGFNSEYSDFDIGYDDDTLYFGSDFSYEDFTVADYFDGFDDHNFPDFMM